MSSKNRFSSRDRKTLWPWLWIATIVILLDQLSKSLVTHLINLQETIHLTSFFNIVLAFNRGAAFSFLATQEGWQRYFFTIVGLLAALVIIYLLMRHAEARLFCWALSLILGGALGNVIDRIWHGHVIDFLDFHIKNWHWPAFNLADSAIFVGAALFILDELRRVKK